MSIRVLLGALLACGGCDTLPPAPPPVVAESAAVLAPPPCGAPARPWGSPGCPAPATPSAPPPGPAAAAPAPSTNSPAGPAGSRAQPVLPGTVIEVEVSGKVIAPPGAPAGRLVVVISDGPCFQPGSHYLGVTAPAPGGNYLFDLFPPFGTRLEACAALIEPRRSAVGYWGRADRGTLIVQGRNRMVYRGTDIPVRRAPDVHLPPGLALPR